MTVMTISIYNLTNVGRMGVQEYPKSVNISRKPSGDPSGREDDCHAKYPHPAPLISIINMEISTIPADSNSKSKYSPVCQLDHELLFTQLATNRRIEVVNGIQIGP